MLALLSLGFPRSLALASVTALAVASGSVACDALTTPPEPEAIAKETVTAASASAAPAQPSASAAPSALPPSDPNAKLVTADLSVGKGAEAKTGDTVSVHYVGTLADGKEFDSSRKRGKPFTFTLGRGNVIKGWDQGVPGMKVGGKRKLVIPSSLAYGDRGMPPTIPPKATLTFEVELVDIKK